MSTLTADTVADRLTHVRLKSYLATTGGDAEAAIRLYDWNIAVAASLWEDISRLEVGVRNAIDGALVNHAAAQRWGRPWYFHAPLFQGRHGARAREDIEGVRRRAANEGSRRASHGQVISELSFGFWRYLCHASYHTSMWVPAVANAFPAHPSGRQVRLVRSDVADRMQRLHFLRNRIAHHEPIHRRDLATDHRLLLELIEWVCPTTRAWAESRSRTPRTLRQRDVDTGEQSA